MDPTSLAVVGVTALLGVVSLWLFGVYRGLVRLEGLVSQSWQQIDDELRRRHDLVPNLLTLVGDRYRAADRVLEDVAQARDEAMTGSGPERAPAELSLSQALDRLFTAAENHPGLRGDESFLALQRELTDMQARVAAGRRLYNANVARLEDRLASFPGGALARTVGVRGATEFESVTSEPSTLGIDLQS